MKKLLRTTVNGPHYVRMHSSGIKALSANHMLNIEHDQLTATINPFDAELS